VEYEFTFRSANSEHYAKRITVLVVCPETMDDEIGLMHFCHGWGNNRFQYAEMQREFAERYNVVGIATEFRQSGYDFDPTTGVGAYLPYDHSHMQVIDCLNAVRVTLEMYPNLNKDRILLYGGSQGAHISPLMTVFAPDTFALLIAACGISQVDALRQRWAGRHFSADELAIRDLLRLARRIQCPVVLTHGTADETVSWENTTRFEEALRTAGKEVRAKYIEGGGHSLEPVTTRRDVVVDLADDWLGAARRPGPTDFGRQAKVAIPCETRQFVIDWSKPVHDWTLVAWEDL
jgi:predicted esterase